MERREIERLIGPMHQPFRRTAPHSGRLLQPMPGKPVEEDKIADLRVGADDGIVIKRIRRVMPGPFAGEFDRFELRDAGGDDGPDVILPEVVIHFEIVERYGGVMGGMPPGQIGPASVFPDNVRQRGRWSAAGGGRAGFRP